MKLMTERGELALPAGYSLTVEQNNPLFSRDGSGTVPATIPASPHNLAVLGFPERLGARTRFVRRMQAKMAAGTIHKDGVLGLLKGRDLAVHISLIPLADRRLDLLVA